MEIPDDYKGREHSFIKHRLLEAYIQRLFMIIGQYESRISLSASRHCMYHREYTYQESAFFILISSSLTPFASSILSIPSISPSLLIVILSIWLRMIFVKRGLSAEIFAT